MYDIYRWRRSSYWIINDFKIFNNEKCSISNEQHMNAITLGLSMSLRQCERLPCGHALGRSRPLITFSEFWRFLCCLNFWLHFPSGRAWKTSRWMTFPPPSTSESRMILFNLDPSLKGLVIKKTPKGGIEVLPLPS